VGRLDSGGDGGGWDRGGWDHLGYFGDWEEEVGAGGLEGLKMNCRHCIDWIEVAFQKKLHVRFTCPLHGMIEVDGRQVVNNHQHHIYPPQAPMRAPLQNLGGM
jgi:hypothetical protein